VIRNLLLSIKKCIAPPFCLYCRAFLTEYVPYCIDCSKLIKPVLSERISLSPHHSMQVLAVSAYEDPLKRLILAKGWSHYQAARALGRIVWDYSLIKRIPVDYLVPIPLHVTRYAVRGYNQSQVIADELARLSGKPVLSALKRIKRTAQQSSVTGPERVTNVAHAFNLVEAEAIRGKVIVLIDDLMTTGSTLQAAGQELLKGEPREIVGVVVCRAYTSL
jgi:ComF family protein